MRTWDEYEIHLLKEWCEKNQISLLERKEENNEESFFHFDIRRSDIPILMKDDMLYRGNWKGNKAKYQVLYPMNLFWDMIFVSIWSGLQKLSDWVNAICTLRNVVPHEGLTEFQFNQWRFTIWNEREGEWFCFDIQKNVVGRREEWSPDAPIQWSPLPNIHPPSIKDDSYHGFLQANTLETETKTEVSFQQVQENENYIEENEGREEEPIDTTNINQSIIQEDNEEQCEYDKKAENKKRQWSLRDIQSWLSLGCPIMKPTMLHKELLNKRKKDGEGEADTNDQKIKEEETGDNTSSSFVSQILPMWNEEAEYCLQQKKQFLEHWWFLSQWGRSHLHLQSRPFTQIALT
jgi:hypothetical protein